MSTNSGEYRVSQVISPIEIVLDNSKHCFLNGIETFDSDYTENNKKLADRLNISENEAFIIGSLGREWTKNLLLGRKIKLADNNFIFYKFGYLTRLENSPYCIKDGIPTNKATFARQLNAVRKGNFIIINLDNDNILPVSKGNREKVSNFVVIRRSHAKKIEFLQKNIKNESQPKFLSQIKLDGIKIIVSDLTTKTKPDRECSSDICREILSNINNASKTIDMAIYGYSSTPAIENALKSALSRGVKIRLVYDSDKNNSNIYPDTKLIVKLIPNSKSDYSSRENENTMHNKFYIFDNETVITGSANLSHTDMSGFNSNSIIVVKSNDVAKYYTQEFEQMYSGKFHNDKISTPNKTIGNVQIYFSPQDKTITNGILPLIKNAKNYIYIPTFVITEKRITDELIAAKNRGVDVKIILDALNASSKHSKHKELRNSGIPLKAENWAGKMHSKSMIIDDTYLVIGSMNLSKSGETRNDENTIILKNPKAAILYRDFFLYQWNKIPDKWLKQTPRAEGPDSVGSCSDGLDNNYDGQTDSDDVACKAK